MVFRVGKLHGPVTGTRPIHHADVSVSVGDAMDVQKTGRAQGACAGFVGGRAFAEKLYFQAALLPGFPEGGNLWVFIKLDMPAKRQPLVESAMVDEQNFSVANDEDHYSEV